MNLVDGELYYARLRHVDSNGNISESIDTPTWRAKRGVGTWGSISQVNELTKRGGPSTIWTGDKMIVWGGQLLSGGTTNTGAVYDPATDTWTTMSMNNAPSARVVQTAIWTGHEMIIWGGAWTKTGSRYNPNTNTWSTVSTTNAPTGCVGHTAVWTGSKMIVWGGQEIINPYPYNNYANTGGYI